jgi:hypothetical protein
MDHFSHAFSVLRLPPNGEGYKVRTSRNIVVLEEKLWYIAAQYVEL